MTEEKQVSLVKGVHYSPSQKMWYARKPNKTVLYRGKFKLEAEAVRKLFDKNRIVRRGGRGSHVTRDKYRNVQMINFLPPKPTYENMLTDGYWEQ